MIATDSKSMNEAKVAETRDFIIDCYLCLVNPTMKLEPSDAEQGHGSEHVSSRNTTKDALTAATNVTHGLCFHRAHPAEPM